MSLTNIRCDCPMGYNWAANCPNCTAKNALEADETAPLDVWLKMYPSECLHSPEECDCDDESEYEANTYPCHGGGFTVEWYHTAVGQVSSKWFPTYGEAAAWLTKEGFSDYSS